MAIDRMPPTTRHLPARLAFGPALRLQSDRRLVGLVRAGDERAFEEIVRRYRKPLDRFAASIVGAAADDVTQDSFRKALEALRHAEADVELRPWLFRIVRNTALNDLRDRPPAAAELAEELVAGGRSAAAEAEQRAELRDLTTQLQALPENQRAALVMRELEGMGHEEIAAALGISDGAARQAIARARSAIRSGVGALIPVPVLRALASAADGLGGSGAAAGGGAIAAGAGGIGVGALKVGLATVVVAGTIGAGVAIERHGGGHASGEPQRVAVAPQAERASTARTTADPSPALSPSTEGGDRSAGDGSGSGRDGHRSRRHGGHAGKGDTGPRLVPVAHQTPVTAPEAGGGPGPSHGAGGNDGSGESDGGHRTPGDGGHQGSVGGGDHRGSDGGGDHGSFGGGSSGGEDSGGETSGGRTSGSSSGEDGSSDGGVTTTVQSTDFSDDGSSSGGGGDTSGSGGDGGGSDVESVATPETALPSVNEPLPEGASEPSP